MRISAIGLGVLLGVALAGELASAQPYYPSRPQAPDACGPGYYCTGPCGMTYGPGYCVKPCFPPFQGVLPGPPPGTQPGGPWGWCPPPAGAARAPGAPPGPPGSPTFPTHPYARSPRDYFMYYDRGYADRDYFMGPGG
jgi:hypothetical protein